MYIYAEYVMSQKFKHLYIVGICNQKNHKSLSFAYMGSCYTLHFEPVSWSKAYVNCKTGRTSLAMMKTKKAINDISVKIKMVHRESVYYWIGLRRFQWKVLAKQGTCMQKIQHQ